MANAIVTDDWRHNMTAVRKEVNDLIDNMSDENLSFVSQIIRGINVLTSNDKSKKETAFSNLEQIRKKGTVVDDAKELASYREEKLR